MGSTGSQFSPHVRCTVHDTDHPRHLEIENIFVTFHGLFKYFQMFLLTSIQEHCIFYRKVHILDPFGGVDGSLSRPRGCLLVKGKPAKCKYKYKYKYKYEYKF